MHTHRVRPSVARRYRFPLGGGVARPEARHRPRNPAGTAPPRVRAGTARLALMALLAATSADAAYLILEGSGKRIEGSALRRNARGQYVIETEVGMQTFAPSQVASAEADQPEAWNQAMAAARSDPARAMEMLQDIAARYEGLGWDEKARVRLAQLAMRVEDYETAIRAFEALSAERMENDEFRLAYWEALLQAERFDRLEEGLDAAIRSGGRELSARATLLRGDLRMKRRQWQPAALDYLRVVILYAAVQEVQPEALYKAGTALRELRDPRAEEQFEELKRKYPSSEWAGKS